MVWWIQLNVIYFEYCAWWCLNAETLGHQHLQALSNVYEIAKMCQSNELVWRRHIKNGVGGGGIMNVKGSGDREGILHFLYKNTGIGV